jgi:amino acid adenylation domain-containing protein
MNVLQKSFKPMNDILFSGRNEIEFSPKPVGPTSELSFAQQRLWFLEQIAPGRTTYAIPMAIELRGELDAPRLERAFGELVSRHESLRTVFETVQGQPQQLILEPSKWTLPVTNLNGEANPRGRLNELLQAEATHGFDLTRGPLFRTRLYQLAADHHVLLLAMHHIISDGWSIGILFQELSEFYGRFCRGETAVLPTPAVQYREFAQWQRQRLRGEVLEKLLDHWRSRLVGAPQVLELPTDRPRPAVERSLGAVYQFTLPAELVEALRRFARREKATLFMPLLAGFAALLSRYSGQEDFLLGTPVANRNRAEFEGVVGCFVNTLVLRANLSGDPTVGELLLRTRQVCLDALQHQDLPFERLVEELQLERDLSRNPLVQVMFSLENMPLQPLQLAGLTQSQFDLGRSVTHVDLTLRAQETTGGLRALLEYSTDLFDAPSIERMAAHWRTLLEAMAASPERRLSQLPLLTAVERLELLVGWNRTTADYPRDSLVHELFEVQARRTPEATAVSFERQRMTYDELNRRSNQIAHYLRQLGVGADARVGICVERSLEMIAGLLGILKTGAAYVPLDPSFPKERLRFMADDAQISVLLTQQSLRQQFQIEISNLKLLCVDELPHESGTRMKNEDDHVSRFIHHASISNTERQTPTSEHPAYVIYTSGSTGKPKGVVVPHRAVVNFLASMAREPGLAVNDVLVAVTTLSFDIAVLELLLPLMVGAKVVIASRDQTLDGRALATLLEQHHATVMQATPVTWRILLETGWTPRRKFKALVGGEALPKDLAEQLLARGIELWNMFGPTETTVWSTCARINGTSSGITIGKPIANTTVRILDARKNLYPIGVPGELFIGGDGVSLGYWNRPELTAERFIPDPFGATPDAKLYRTGDRARWHNDGTIEHLGRLDSQIKLRGFRIELGEIETVIAQQSSVREVAAVLRGDNPGDKCLVAYVAAENPPADLSDQLRVRVRNALPEYMVPAHFVLLKALPRTPNGKLDRNVLPAPVTGNGSSHKITAPPRTPAEEMVMDVFRTVLDQTNFGVTDSFFDLGGHSLMAARLMLKLRSASGFDLPMRLLFERPTPARLAEAIDSLAWLKQSKAPTPAVGGREEIEL